MVLDYRKVEIIYNCQIYLSYSYITYISMHVFE